MSLAADMPIEPPSENRSSSDAALRRRLVFSIALNVGIILIELVGGWLANSIGLLSDAAHNATDVAVLVISWYAVYQATKPSHGRRTFGYHRAEILTALFNAALFLAMTGWLITESAQRFLHPEPVDGRTVAFIAALAFGANLWTAVLLRRSAADNLSVKSAFIHMVADALISLGVIVSGLIIGMTGWTALDAASGAVISLVIAGEAWKILRESVTILLEGVPTDIDTDAVAAQLRAAPGVRDINDLHIWALGSGLSALSCRVVVDDMPISRTEQLTRTLRRELRERFGISHATVEYETVAEPKPLYCDLKSPHS
ncbi:MAG TPA: cation diffusion facilitator family transporter [Nitrospiria bacterium]|nr:cation diffusion facilitator family transporter [Nitrospiria bacterium]